MESNEHVSENPTAIQPPPRNPFEETITTLMRGKKIVIGTFLVVLALTSLYTFLSKPAYQAESMVLVDAKSAEGRLPFLDISGTSAATKITNELETLKARSTVEAVATALLDMTYMDSSSKRYIPIIRAQVNGEPQDAKDNVAAVVNRLQRATDFTPVKESDIIRITVRTNDPQEAALIANTYARVYAERNTSASRVKSRAIREFLQTQMQSKHQNLDSTEHALQVYMRSSGVVSLDAEANKVVEQLSRLEATRDGIEVEISSRTKTLTSYKQELAVQEPNVAKAIGESNDTYIRLLQEQLAKLEVQRDVVIAQNPDMSGEKIYSEKLREIDNQIASLKKNLAARTQTFLGSLIPAGVSNNNEGGTASFLAQVKQRIIEQQIELDGLNARKLALNQVVAEYEKQFNQIPQKSIELAKLQRARLSNEKLYLLVEEKYNEAAITETSEFGYINVMDPAAIPDAPVSPKVLLNHLFGGILGFLLGVGYVMVRAKLDDRIQSPEDLKKRGVSLIGTIGVMDVERRANGTRADSSPSSTPKLDESLVACFSPLSSTAEGYRHLRTSLEYNQPDAPSRTIVVTSPAPKEGKSTTAANLAISFSQGESRVLLVDADLRCPVLHTLFGLEKEPGISDVIFSKKRFEEVVHRNVVENLDVLCCGITPPNPAEILKSRRMRDFVAHAKSSYDIVIFDCPPLLAVTDAAILSRIVDSVILVVSAGQTGISAVERAGEILQSVGRQSVGVVLNNFDMKKAYGGYYGRYRYDHYSYGYGYTSDKRKRKVLERER